MAVKIGDNQLISKVQDNSQVTGLTHNFYYYPARFSPQFSRAIIREFTSKNDYVLDPFMGGGTSIIEAIALGRNAIGIDINELAHFITRVKSTIYNDEELNEFKLKGNHIIDSITLNHEPRYSDVWLLNNTLRNLNYSSTWRLERIISLYKDRSYYFSKRIQNLFRCALLKVSQWAIDNNNDHVSLGNFRNKLRETIDEFITGAKDFREKSVTNSSSGKTPILIHGSSVNINRYKILKEVPQPKLLITSPPYPGIHILYHRWQVNGRRETSAPYWIANIEDGQGESYYTFGSRNQKNLKRYFEIQLKSFLALRNFIGQDTLVIQLVAFSDPDWQLGKYLTVMEQAGFHEENPFNKRIWRTVPNRKWYAQKNGSSSSSKEILLFHKVN